MKQRLLHILLIFFFSLTPLISLYGQTEQEASDTILHKENKHIYKQEEFYRQWEKKSSKKIWTHQLFKLLFDPPSETTPYFYAHKSLAQSYRKYEGMKIRSITFETFLPFGKTINGIPTDSTDNKFAEFGNRIHMRTKLHHLRRLLSIKAGDRLDIRQLEANEEMLRSLAYVDELYMAIRVVNDDVIDLHFLIKERFSWSLSYQAHNLDAHKLKIYNKNLWGLGHRAKLSYFYNASERIKHSYGLEYKIPTINKSLISLTTILEHNNHNDKYAVELSRDFIDNKTKYAGGIALNLVKDADQTPTNEIAHFENNLDYHEGDIWAGISIPHNIKDDKNYARYRKAITGRLYRINFTKHPEVKRDSNVFLLKTTGALLGYNFSKQQLYISNMMYSYGRVENIPYGHLTQLFVGTVFNNWQRKGYVAANFQRGYYNSNKDYYFSTRLTGGTFFDKNDFLDGLVSIEGKYITKLYKFRNTQHRHFIRLKYVMGFNVEDDFLNLNENNGIRNFNSEKAEGDKKLVLNFEDVFFTPISILGFQTAFFSFGDIGYIQSSENSSFSSNNINAGIGLGMRLHNRNFIFDTFQVSFSLFLKRPDDVNIFEPDVTSERNRTFQDYQIEKPYFYFEKESLKY